MIEVKDQYPFIDTEGNERPDLIKHWGEDKETGKKYAILQKETGIIYGEAIDAYPCKYTYDITDEEIETEEKPIKLEEVEEPIEENKE